jgi:PAS domain S-box-containing protein
MTEKPSYEQLEKRVRELERAESKRKQAEEALKDSEERLRLALAGSGVSFWEYLAKDERVDFDENWARFLGNEPGENYIDFHDWLQRLHPDSVPMVEKAMNDYVEGRVPRYEVEYHIKTRAGEWKWVSCAGIAVDWDENQYPARVLGTHKDISARKEMEQERERLITELEDALAKVRKLSGMLPICSSCKKIRDDKGYWNQIESYLSHHSEAEFSHGICPECAKKIYPNFVHRGKRDDAV